MSTALRIQRVVVMLVNLSAILAFIYASVSIGLTMILAYQPPMPVTQTPSSLGLTYQSVVFFSRGDHLLLRGWFMPGLLTDGHLTDERNVILVHGMHANRATPLILGLSGALVHQGIAVFTFDMRGHGESSPAPQGGGYFEQRDVLGAVDFLRSGPLLYPELGHPHFIGGWGLSSGGVALLFAAVQEPALKALIIDSAYATLESLIRHDFGYGYLFIPGVRVISQLLYGIDYYAVRPVDVVAKVAPRPILFIHGAADKDVPPSDMTELATAASAAPHAHVQTWLVPNARHIEAYFTMNHNYIERVVAFFTAELKD